jgi:hypothetical protein
VTGPGAPPSSIRPPTRHASLPVPRCVPPSERPESTEAVRHETGLDGRGPRLRLVTAARQGPRLSGVEPLARPPLAALVADSLPGVCRCQAGDVLQGVPSLLSAVT